MTVGPLIAPGPSPGASVIGRTLTHPRLRAGAWPNPFVGVLVSFVGSVATVGAVFGRWAALGSTMMDRSVQTRCSLGVGRSMSWSDAWLRRVGSCRVCLRGPGVDWSGRLRGVFRR